MYDSVMTPQARARAQQGNLSLPHQSTPTERLKGFALDTAPNLALLQSLLRAAKFKDNDTEQHLTRMSYYSWLLAKAIGQADDWCDLLLKAAPLHDIGKIGTPDSILKKPGRLTEKERVEMERHVEYGALILGDVSSPLFNMTREVILGHHEKWDGSGYPAKLQGLDIPIAARIVAIADVFDALTSKRPYKEAWSIEAALEFMLSEAGKHFDPMLIEVFASLAPRLERVSA